jgi:aminoglycoside 6'-N-acetyltransferase
VIEFEPLREDDLPLVRDWLEREHVRRWWRDPIDEAIDKRRQGIEAGRTEQYLIVVEGRPAGLIQTYLVADSPDWEEIVGPEPVSRALTC